LIIKAFNNHRLAIVIPCTKQKPKIPHYSIVFLPKGTAHLRYDSFALCNQIRTISYERILKRIGLLDEMNFLKIQMVLKDTLEL